MVLILSLDDAFRYQYGPFFVSVAIATCRETIFKFYLLSSLHSNYKASYLSVVSL